MEKRILLLANYEEKESIDQNLIFTANTSHSIILVHNENFVQDLSPTNIFFINGIIKVAD